MGKKAWRILLRTAKWGLILLFGFYFLGMTIFGFKDADQSGSWTFYWSGLEAFWDPDEEFGIWINKKMQAEFNGLDGPYLIGDSIFRVDSSNRLYAHKLDRQDSLLVEVNNRSMDRFYVAIRDLHPIAQEIYPMPQRLMALSDIEGNFNGFVSFLASNGVIDDQFNWTFGDGHLVLVGDFVDRGENVPQVLWLIYQLEEQAKRSGGKVHFILGNHEIMNFQGNWSYNARKYRKANQAISGLDDWQEATRFMYSKSTELGQWLQSKNVIEKIGSYIFVHAGLSPEILEHELSLAEINRITRENWTKDLYDNPSEDEVANFLIGRKGPFWYRGTANDYKYYDKIIETELEQILAYYTSEKLVIGHTVFDDISTDFDGKVIRIDIKHGEEKNSGQTKGLLIENGIEYKLDDLGNKVPM
ncbi:MAG: metallophosphoesterase [Bacteroidota bacterium]